MPRYVWGAPVSAGALAAFGPAVASAGAPYFWPGYRATPGNGTFDGDTMRPPGPAPRPPARCECGASATYGAGATHSDWCPLGVRP